MKVLDLFSGIGGFSLGLKRVGMETIAFCEIEPFCQRVLNKHWPSVPVATDIRKLSYRRGVLYEGSKALYRGRIDLICGGFPCQPFSLAGKKKGVTDDRDLWPSMFRIIQECQPTWIIGENVANFGNMAFRRTKINLEAEGYEVQPLIIPACAVGAPHRRDRFWIVAHADRTGLQAQGAKQQAARIKQYRKLAPFIANRNNQQFVQYQSVKPTICRGDNGFPYRVDRIRALGNAVVPQIPEIIGGMIVAGEGLSHQA